MIIVLSLDSGGNKSFDLYCSYDNQVSDVHQGGLGTAVASKNTGAPGFGQVKTVVIYCIRYLSLYL